MGDTDRTKEQLIQELAQARKRIDDLEAAAITSGKLSSIYYGIFENFMESATDSFSIWDSNLNLVYINNTNLRYLPGGTKKSDVLGKNIKEIIPTVEKTGRYEKYKQVLETGEPLNVQEFRADPKFGDAYLSIKVFKISDGIGIISTDVTERMKAQEALRQSEEKLRAIFEAICDSVTVIDLNGNITDVNDAAVKLFGCRSRQEVLGMHSITFIADEHQPAAIAKLHEGLPTRFFRYKFKRIDGSSFWGETSSDVIRDKLGNVTGFVGIVMDITERKRTEDALRESEERLRRYINNAPDAIFVYDFNGNFLDGNKRGEEITGYTRDEIIGKNFMESGLFSERYALKAMNAVQKDIRGESTEPEEYEITRKDGGKRYLEAKSFVASTKGKGEVIGIARDITKRKELEEKLRQSEEKIRQVFNSVGVGITVTDMEGKVTEVNDFGLRLCGYTKEEMVGHKGILMIAERDRPRVIEEMVKAFNTGRSCVQEFTSLKKNGSEYEVEAIATVIRDVSEKPLGLIISAIDITERKRIEKELNDYEKNLEQMVQERTSELAGAYEELRESEERLRGFFENVPDILFAHNMQGQFTDINRKGLVLSGYSRDEVVGKNVLEVGILPPDQIEGVAAALKGIEEGKSGYLYEVQLMKKDGDRITVEAVSFPIKRKGITEVMGIARDVTERKRVEEALKESETKYRTLVEQSDQGICILQRGRIAFANNALTKINGYSIRELYAMSRDELLTTVHSEDRQIFKKRIKSGAKSNSSIINFEYRIVRKDGAIRYVETHAKRIIYEGHPALQATVADCTDRRHWEEKLKKSKEELRFYLNQITRVQEEERKRISRELHDDTIQELVALSRQLDDLGNRSVKPDEDRMASRKTIEQARQKLDSILEGVRRFTRDLRPSILDDLGLIPALEWLTSDMSSRLNIPISFSIIGTEKNLSPDTTLAMFRIAQESLSNAGHHAKASHIQVSLKYAKKNVILSIIDNGKGFTLPKNIASLTKRGKLGIAGMNERAQLINATLSIKSRHNEGTAITLEVPIKQAS